jgi:1-acyl-sn-glycerol-3-phosphate acyltransferase
MRTLYAIWTWLVMTVISAIGFVIVGTMRLLIWPFDRRRLITGRAIRIVAICIVKCNPVWRFRVHGKVPKRLPERCVCVSNHCSHTDPFLMSHLPWEMKWLAKSGLFKIPFIGWGMRLAGDIPLVRGSTRSAKLAMDRCAKYVESGVPVVIFPEGTRSETDEMLPFKDGAFSLAIRLGADVLPMAVAGTRTALPKHDWRPDYSHGVVVVGEPISTKGLTASDVKELKQRARSAIEKLRAEAEAAVR